MRQTSLRRYSGSRPTAARIEVIGAACGQGASDPRCESAPDHLRATRLIPRLRSRGINAIWRSIVRPSTHELAEPLQTVGDVCTRLARHTHNVARRGNLPLVLGGDHSCAIGTWKGVAQAHAARGALGLLWIDAHMDAHTPATTPSGRLHGMPLACLLGHGAPALTAIAGEARLDPRYACLIGVRSFEAGEAALLKHLGVKVFYMRDIERDGLEAVMRAAFARVSAASAGFGVSLDVDAVDPRDAPGTGITVPGGIRAVELCGALSLLAGHPALRGVEIVEYNPYHDEQGVTAAMIADVIESIMAGQPMLPLEIPRMPRLRAA